jgi:hypothetical protein
MRDGRLQAVLVVFGKKAKRVEDRLERQSGAVKWQK